MQKRSKRRKPHSQLPKPKKSRSFWMKQRVRQRQNEKLYRQRHREQRRESQRNYNSHIGGVAAGLRAHYGYRRLVSIKLAGLVLNENSRCAICGIPVYQLRQMPFWRNGGRLGNRRLTVDHCNPNGPSTLYNSRIVCYSCNWLRGRAELTDMQVLRRMRSWYLEHFTSRFLFWLNTTPGHGGRLHRNKYTEARDRRLHGKD